MATIWTEKGQPPPPLAQGLFAEVRRALNHLYDSVYLQRSSLVALLRACAVEPILLGQEAKALRKLLIESIDQLTPGDNVPLRSEKRRAYAALRGRYVDQVAMEDLARNLGLSERQLRRELRAGLEAVTTVVAARLEWQGNESASDESLPDEGQVAAEIQDLSYDAGPVNLCAELRNVQELVAPLAQSQGVTLEDRISVESLIVHASRVVLRQVLLALYSWTIQYHPHAVIVSRLSPPDSDEACFELDYPLEPAADAPETAVPADLLQAVQGRFEWVLAEPNRGVFRLTLPRVAMHSVLLVDDNPSLHRLCRRYLSGLPYRLHSAYDAINGLSLARSERPEAIILDIMMPDQDGWELLHELKADPDTSHIPVVICSVLGQEALAQSLAASGYIKKPITQGALLSALRALGLYDTL